MKNIRIRVLALVLIFFLMIILFATLYQQIYNQLGFKAFSFNESIIKENVKYDLKFRSDQLGKIRNQKTILELIKINLDSINLVLKYAREDSYNKIHQFRLSPSISFKLMKSETPGYETQLDPGIKMNLGREDIYKVELLNKRQSSIEHTTYLNDLFNSGREITINDIQKLRRKLSETEKMHDFYLTSSLRDSINLDFSHFIYLSTSVMTTLGTNEIYPNNWDTRILISFQAVISLFLLGYGLDLIWKSYQK